MIGIASKSVIYRIVLCLGLLFLPNFTAGRGRAAEVGYARITGALEMRGIGPVLRGGRTGYRRPVPVALRGGRLPEQLSRLRGSVIRYRGPLNRMLKSLNVPIFKQPTGSDGD
jgi:hypothetical protein